MNSVESKHWTKRVDWPVTLFLLITPLFALIFTPIYFSIHGLSWPLLAFAVIYGGATNLSVTAGYHRLFSHRSYEAHPIARAFFLLVGAAAWQGSALKWSADHRQHHGYEDTENDPYAIHKGFWYAHMGWLFLRDSTNQNPKAADLEKSWMIRMQHKYYMPLAIFMGFGVPTWVGLAMGSPWGGFVIAGALRIVLTQQSTFFVNSLCHYWGKQTYSEKITAKDSIIVAFLTHGEGYHNFHHKFPVDYRNGIRWYQWDPTKWTIQSLALVGMATRLKKMSQQEILKAHLQMDEIRIKSRGYSETKVAQMKEKVLHAQQSVRKLKEDYKKLKQDYAKFTQDLSVSYEHKLEEIKRDIAIAKMDLKYAMREWKVLARSRSVATIGA